MFIKSMISAFFVFVVAISGILTNNAFAQAPLTIETEVSQAQVENWVGKGFSMSTDDYLDATFNATNELGLSRLSGRNQAEADGHSIELQGEDFLFQQLADQKLSEIQCLNVHAPDILTSLFIFPAEDGPHGEGDSENTFLKIMFEDNYEGKSWPIHNDTPRVGTISNIELEIDYPEFPSEQLCTQLQTIQNEGQRELNQTEQGQLSLCGLSCKDVSQAIIGDKRAMSDGEKLALKICQRDISRSMLMRKNIYSQLGDVFEVNFAKEDCSFSGFGTIDCSHRRSVKLGQLEITGVNLLAKQQITVRQGIFRRSYWLNLDFRVKVSESRTHIFNLEKEYELGELQINADSSSSSDDETPASQSQCMSIPAAPPS